MSKTIIQFQDSKKTVLDSSIITGFRIINSRPRTSERIFTIELVLGKIEVQLIRLEYVIPDENIKKQYREFLEENPLRPNVIISVAKWTKEDFLKTEETFNQDLETIRRILS
jgi:hypothetical protein